MSASLFYLFFCFSLKTKENFLLDDGIVKRSPSIDPQTDETIFNIVLLCKEEVNFYWKGGFDRFSRANTHTHSLSLTHTPHTHTPTNTHKHTLSFFLSHPHYKNLQCVSISSKCASSALFLCMKSCRKWAAVYPPSPPLLRRILTLF